jgi:hypothetical protein
MLCLRTQPVSILYLHLAQSGWIVVAESSKIENWIGSPCLLVPEELDVQTDIIKNTNNN